jgi:hypothetical protein
MSLSVVQLAVGAFNRSSSAPRPDGGPQASCQAATAGEQQTRSQQAAPQGLQQICSQQAAPQGLQQSGAQQDALPGPQQGGGVLNWLAEHQVVIGALAVLLLIAYLRSRYARR